jgi:polynucleotide 5'-hydroxyl-kinase GRC3/NOL9
MEPKHHSLINIDVPSEWREIDFKELSGTILILGAPDTGKSTFARFLYSGLVAAGLRTALLDGDPGQSQLGPPATMTLLCPSGNPATTSHPAAPPEHLLRTGQFRRSFVGSTTPVGHMLQLVVGGARLVNQARKAYAQVVVYDTCGLIDPNAGGLVLKMAKIDLLKPTLTFTFQLEDELEPILSPLRKSRRTFLWELTPSTAVQKRTPNTRKAHRIAQFADYFRDARPLTLRYDQLGVFPSIRFPLHHLVALEDSSGYTIALGIILDHNSQKKEITLHTPLQSSLKIVSITIGDLEIDPQTYVDWLK